VCPGAGCRVVLVCVRNGRIDVHLRRQVSNSWEKGLMGFQNATDIARLAEPCVVPRIGVLKAQSENREPNAVAAQTNVRGKSESEKTR
jgi:hypothetical protein